MIYPSFEDITQLKDSYTMLPISKKVWSDHLTPIRLFKQIKGEYSFLFESVEGGEKWARYSFIGHKPFLMFSAKEGKGYVQRFKRDEKGHIQSIETESVSENPLQMLKQLLQTYEIPPHMDLPRFSGGAVGYVGYDAIKLVENIPEHVNQLHADDDIRLIFCDEIIAFDHLQQEITFISHLRVRPGQSQEAFKQHYEQTCANLSLQITHILDKVKEDDFDFFHVLQEKPEVDWNKVSSNFTKENFMQAVDRVKEYILAGDIFQTVLSQRFTIDIQTDPFNIYRVLRTVNPSPYLYYLDLGDNVQIIGSSPERLVQVEGDLVETNPIAGTRPRGKTKQEDEQLAEELMADEKELAEHHMLLDLGRNDIGRVANYGSVQVKKNMEIEKFSHVMHICSTVEGKIAPGKDAIDCLFACFPAGTVSGAPKIRAMEIIAELESDARHAYSGAIGYFSFSGNHDSCLAIRTIFVRDGKADVQAGAGIVADSLPENEWQETRNKAKALLVAIQLAEHTFPINDKGEKLNV